MCIRDEVHHLACGHDDIVLWNCGNHSCPSAHRDLPVQIVTVMQSTSESRCRECRINRLIDSRPESPTLEILIRAAEREDCYWELNTATVADVHEEAPAQEQWYSPRVRGWTQELRNMGFVTTRERYSNGFYERARDEELTAIPELEPGPEYSDSDGADGFEDDASFDLFDPSTAMERDALALPRVLQFINSLPIVDLATVPEEDCTCMICLEPYVQAGSGDKSTTTNELVTRLPCAGGHMFGRDCLRELFLPSNNHLLRCPMCRESLLVAQGEKIGEPLLGGGRQLTTEEGTEEETGNSAEGVMYRWPGIHGAEPEDGPEEDTQEDSEDIDGWRDMPYAFLK